MSHVLINRTLPVVIQEIDQVLDEYPEHPYQSAFLLPELRQKLIAHVLTHSPNRYALEEVESPNNTQVPPPSRLKERLRMEMIIRGSILHILRENANWLHSQNN